MDSPLPDNEPDDAFFEQVARYLDGQLTAAEFARFEEALAGDPGKCTLFSEICIQATLVAGSGIHAAQDVRPRGLQAMSDASRGQSSRFPMDSPSSRRRRSPMRGFFRRVTRPLRRYRGDPRFALAMVWISTLLFAGVVAGVVAAVTVMWRGGNVPGDQQIADQGPVQPSAPSAPVARLNRVVDCVWSSETSPPSVGDDLVAGRKLVLKSGLVEVVFRNGVQAIVEGPAVFEVSSRTSGRLSRGKCAVTVEDPSARGFKIDAPGMKYTDLGTEFGVLVAQSGLQEMHVFRGKVQAEQGGEPAAGSREQGAGSKRPRAGDARSPLIVSAHEAIRVAAADASGGPLKPIEHIAVDEKQFVRNDRLTLVAAQQLPTFRRWKQFSDELCKRPDLAAYYDFQPDESDRTVLRNRAATGRALDGRIEGAAWSDGHLPGKTALRFASRDDRVRVDLPGSYDALTLAAWVNVENLNNEFNSILNSDRWLGKVGQYHWELRSDGTVASGICWATTEKGSTSGVAGGSSGTALARPDFGAWRHIAAVYDSRARSETFFVNGRPCGTVRFKASLPLVFGSSQIGNWAPANAKDSPVRNMYGRIAELVVFRSALSEAEIRQLYENSAARSGDGS